MTIEWVLEKAWDIVLRLDLTRRNLTRISGEEGVTASMFFCRSDDEANVIGHIDYVAPERCSGHITFKHSERREEWTTLVGDVIAHWDQEWRVTSTIQCRLGVWDEKHKRMYWERISINNLLVVQHIARMRGAIEQFTRTTSGINESFVLGAATRDLNGIIRRANSELKSQFTHL